MAKTKKDIYYVLCGKEEDFEQKLIDGGIKTDFMHLLKFGFYSKIGKLIRKEGNKRL